jgi:DNA-binding FadR family transcriptional regulator
MKMLDRTRQNGGLTLTGQLLETLGQAIVAGEFDGKSFPTEAEISQRYETSRSVTREAVKMLTAKGMLTARPRSGITAQAQERWSLLDPDVLRWMLERKFSYDLLRHFTEMRLGLEPAGAALAAQHATPQALRVIEQGLERMAAAERGDGDSLTADIAFHVSILEATGNPFYIQLDQLISTALKISIRMTNRIKGRTANVSAHRRVYDAIRARDPQRARAAMTSILSEVDELISSQSDADKQMRGKSRKK